MRRSGRNISCFVQASMTQKLHLEEEFSLFMLSIRLYRLKLRFYQKTIVGSGGAQAPLPRRAPWGFHRVLMTAGCVPPHHGVPAGVFIGTIAGQHKSTNHGWPASLGVETAARHYGGIV